MKNLKAPYKVDWYICDICKRISHLQFTGDTPLLQLSFDECYNWNSDLRKNKRGHEKHNSSPVEINVVKNLYL